MTTAEHNSMMFSELLALLVLQFLRTKIYAGKLRLYVILSTTPEIYKNWNLHNSKVKQDR